MAVALNYFLFSVCQVVDVINIIWVYNYLQTKINKKLLVGERLDIQLLCWYASGNMLGIINT